VVGGITYGVDNAVGKLLPQNRNHSLRRAAPEKARPCRARAATAPADTPDASRTAGRRSCQR
jgi:hypothetical protein